MYSLINYLIVAILLGVMAALVLVAVQTSPNPRTPRQSWLRRSVVVGISITLSSVCFVLAAAVAVGSETDWARLTASLPLAVALFVGITLFAIVGFYLRAVAWDDLDQFGRWLENKRNSQKRR